MDAGIALTYLVHAEYVKNFLTSTLAFDIDQFFLLLNHQLFLIILDKAGFDSKIFLFNYLVGKKMKYLWNNFSSSLFNVNIGVR